MGRLDGKNAIITGGASGIGAGTTRRFVEEGANVLIADLQEDRAAALIDELGDAVAFIRTDVTNEEAVSDAVSDAVDRWGSLDVMYNNAGFGGALGPITDTSVEDYDITMDVLVKGVFLGIKHAGRVMKEQRSGAIINTASVAGLEVGWAPHFYSVAKCAVIHLTKSTALELGEWNVRINSICPGVIATPLASGRPGHETEEENIARMREQLGPQQPIGRIGEPEDIANAAVYLASDEASFVTGESLVVDGGTRHGRPWSRQDSWITQANPIRVYRPPGR